MSDESSDLDSYGIRARYYISMLNNISIDSKLIPTCQNHAFNVPTAPLRNALGPFK